MASNYLLNEVSDTESVLLGVIPSNDSNDIWDSGDPRTKWHIAVAVWNGCNGEWEGPLTQHISAPAVLTTPPPLLTIRAILGSDGNFQVLAEPTSTLLYLQW